MKKSKETVNLLDLIPVKIVEWLNNDQNLVVLLKPKFSHKFFVKHIIPRMKSPNYKVSLDKFGTAVWHNCDGKNTVAEISECLKKEFGEEIEPVYERLSMFIQTLERSKFIYYANYP